MEHSLCFRKHANHDVGTYDKLLPISLAYHIFFDVLQYLFAEGVQFSDQMSSMVVYNNGCLKHAGLLHSFSFVFFYLDRMRQ